MGAVYYLHDDIAIVGWAGRFPGANSISDLWSLLLEGRCAVTEVPAERFSLTRFGHPRRQERGKSYTFAAGVLDDIWGFDPSVFGISPREAEQMDPATADPAATHLGGIGRCRHPAELDGGKRYRRVRRRLADRLRAFGHRRRCDRRFPFRDRKLARDSRQPDFLHLRPARTERHARYRLLVLAGRPAPGRAGLAQRADRYRGRRRHQRDCEPGAVHLVRAGLDAVADRAVARFLCRCRRLRAGGGRHRPRAAQGGPRAVEAQSGARDHHRVGHQFRRPHQRYLGPLGERAGSTDQAGLFPRRDRPRSPRLRRGSWDRHAGRRPDRSQCARPRSRPCAARRRCRSGRSRPTSVISSRRRALPASSSRCSRSTTASCRARCTSRSPIRRSSSIA